MTKDDMLNTVQDIFRDIFDEDDLLVDRSSNSDSIEEWDSLAHINLVTAVEKEFKVKLNDADKEFVFDETSANLNKFDRLIEEVEPGALRLPVLIKKYIKQNARVVSFNVDPLFNNAIDGLMYIKVKDIPASTVQPVLEEFQASLEAKTQSSK